MSGDPMKLVKFMCGRNSAEDWHPDVQHNHIWLKPLCFADQGPSIIHCPNHIKMRL